MFQSDVPDFLITEMHGIVGEIALDEVQIKTFFSPTHFALF